MLFYKLIPVLIIFILLIINILIIKKNLFLSDKNTLTYTLIGKILFSLLYCQLWGYSYDINSYLEHAQLIINGKVPLKDYLSPYSIGFEYLMSVPVILYNSAESIVLLFLFAEYVTYIILLKLGYSKKEILLIALNPVIFHFTVIDTQDEILMCLFISLFLYAIIKNKYDLLIGFISLFLTKILSILIIFPAYLKNKKNGIILLFICLMAYSILYILGFNILSLEFTRANSNDKISEMITSGNIIWLVKLCGFYSKKIELIAPASLMILNLYFLIFNKSKDEVKNYLGIIASNFFLLLITYKMSFSYYYIIPVISTYLLLFHLKNDLNYSFLVYSFFISINQNLYFIEKSENIGVILPYLYAILQLSLILYTIYLIVTIIRLIKG